MATLIRPAPFAECRCFIIANIFGTLMRCDEVECTLNGGGWLTHPRRARIKLYMLIHVATSLGVAVALQGYGVVNV